MKVEGEQAMMTRSETETKKMCWRFSAHDGWAKAPLPWSVQESTDTDDWSELLKSAGYSQETHFGQEFVFGVDIHVSDKFLPEYLVEVEIGGSFTVVLLSGLPDMLAFLKEVAPLLQMVRGAGVEEMIENMFTKVFRIWHGHDWGNACRECDPDTIQLIQQRRRERPAKKEKP